MLILKWQNTVGSRQRQELVATHLNANSDNEINPQTFCDWLKAPARYSVQQVSGKTSKMAYAKLEKAALGILAKKSNRLLHPEGVQDLASGKFG